MQVVTIYGGENMYLEDNIGSQGGIVNFNLISADGHYIGFSTTNLYNVSSVNDYKDNPYF